MYDPAGTDSGHEWIEVYNDGTSSIPLTDWKLSEGGTNHNIVTVSGDHTFAPGAYAVIAQSATKFQADHPGFKAELFHSAFSLGNSGATITLRDKSLTDVDSVSYVSAWGALGDGNSLQRAPAAAGDFIPRTPTPGAAISPVALTPKAPTAVPTQSPSKKTTTKKTSTKAVSNDAGNETIVATVERSPADAPSQTAAAADTDDSYWWLAAFALAVAGAGAILASKHFKRCEWDIVEEKPEDV